MADKKLRLLGDIMGLSPFPLRFRQALIAVFGEEDVPRTKFGVSSLKQLYPKISPKLWKGKFHLDNTVIISNLYNHTPTPVELGWSVEKTQIKDFRGKGLTYNSHNGTDFAVPVGTTICTAAAGEVVEIRSEFNRGGLKIFIDHGNGLMTCYAHLAKSLVNTGDVLTRAQPIAISGYSGLDAVITYPFGIPHTHFNVWLNGEPTDPFPHNENASLWRNGTMPAPADDSEADFTASEYEPQQLNDAIELCKTEKSRIRIKNIEDIRYRAANLIVEMNYYPTRFAERINIYKRKHPRQPMLDLPFRKSEINNVVFLDDII